MDTSIVENMVLLRAGNGDLVQVDDGKWTYIIPNNVKEIGSRAFYCSPYPEETPICAHKIVVPDSVQTIRASAFAQASFLTEIKLPEGIKRIEQNTFFNCHNLQEISFPDSVNFIGEGALWFCDNISKLKLPASLKQMDGVTGLPNLKEVNYRDQSLTDLEGSSLLAAFGDVLVIELQESAHLAQILVTNGYNLYKYKPNWQKYENVIESNKALILGGWFYFCVDKNSNFNDQLFYSIPNEIMFTLAPSLENLNFVKTGLKKYLEIKDECSPSEFIDYEEQRDFFKMCFSLGVFSGNQQEAEQIKEMLITKIKAGEINQEKVHAVFDTFDINTGYNLSKAELIIQALDDPYFVLNPDYIARINNEYPNIRTFIEREYKELIGRNLITQIRNFETYDQALSLKEKEQYDKLLKELKDKKYRIKHPGMEEVKYYLQNYFFLVKDENKELKSVMPFLRGIKQADFDQLQDLYEESKGLEKKIIQTKDNIDMGYSYQWSAADNPINIALGYIVGCCAKINGAGEGIMRQSMLNPYVQNLIIRDENQNIVAKTTAYYNDQEQYILFNNVEALQNADKIKVQETIQRAVSDQVAALSRNGSHIMEVRMGMQRNDIYTSADLETEKIELLANAYYGTYEGDANNPLTGQGILYRNDQLSINFSK